MTQLESLLREISEIKNEKDLEKVFKEVAIELIQNSVLVVGTTKYLIKEIEFYFYDKQPFILY